jgi:hypothetical protein
LQTEQLIAHINGKPPIRASARLLRMLAEPDTTPERVECRAVDCSVTFPPNKRKRKGVLRVQEYCSKGCAGRETRRRVNTELGKRSGDKRRGKNPDAYIKVRVNGKLELLHRHIVRTHARALGGDLPWDAVVHHIDEDKQHNCWFLNMCARCEEKGYPNLEVLTGDAAAEHLAKHNFHRDKRK